MLSTAHHGGPGRVTTFITTADLSERRLLHHIRHHGSFYFKEPFMPVLPSVGRSFQGSTPQVHHLPTTLHCEEPCGPECLVCAVGNGQGPGGALNIEGHEGWIFLLKSLWSIAPPVWAPNGHRPSKTAQTEQWSLPCPSHLGAVNKIDFWFFRPSNYHQLPKWNYPALRPFYFSALPGPWLHQLNTQARKVLHSKGWWAGGVPVGGALKAPAPWGQLGLEGRYIVECHGWAKGSPMVDMAV